MGVLAGGTLAVLAGSFPFLNFFIGFTHPFIVGPLFIRGQYLEETEKFSGVFLFFIGDVQKDFLRQFVVRGFRKLGICLLYTSRCV